MNVHDFIAMAGNNINIVNAIAKTHNMLERFNRPVCSVSGGADSDVMLDIVYKLDEDKKVRYVWFNTGLEYQATKKHLQDLEEKYGIEIEQIAPVKPIPTCCKEYGQPFISKRVSEFINRAQRHGFDFSYDMPYEDMKEQCGLSIANWWHGRTKIFNIDRNKFMKEFLLENPPKFKISEKCCTYAKKMPINHYIRKNNIDLNMVGIRKAEGGKRSIIKSCFIGNVEQGKFFPIFWFLNADKEACCEIFGVTHSDCYTKYGLERTGCAGCPFNPKVFQEIEQVEAYEPQLIKAARNVFKESYEYTKQYRDFVKERSTRQIFMF